MIILGIETSCDDTGIALIETSGDFRNGSVEVKVLANEINSQEIHAQYGGVFPNIAKREHSKNLIPTFKKALEKAGFGKSKIKNQKSQLAEDTKLKILKILEREQDLANNFLEYLESIEKPEIDAIAVTVGPGLEPCLWTGISFAKALSVAWSIPIIEVNHMEGHIFSALLYRENELSILNDQTQKNTTLHDMRYTLHDMRYTLHALHFPALALLISGGHTEMVLMRDWFNYEIVGKTRDDAVGEAFDKIARILGLPYPGGPHISALAEQVRGIDNYELRITNSTVKLPRPMIDSKDLDFSFSGLKTAVLYAVKKIENITDEVKMEYAKETEDAISDVLVSKVKNAIEKYDARALMVGGGVSANIHIKRNLTKLMEELSLPVFFPSKEVQTDNALMIALAGFLRSGLEKESKMSEEIEANGNLKMDNFSI